MLADQLGFLCPVTPGTSNSTRTTGKSIPAGMTPPLQHPRNQSNNFLMLPVLPHDVVNYSASRVNPGLKEQPPVTPSACQISVLLSPVSLLYPCSWGRIQPCSVQSPTGAFSPLLGKCHALICGRAQQGLQHRQRNEEEEESNTNRNKCLDREGRLFKSSVSSKGSKQGEEANIVLLPPTDCQM